MDRLVVQSGDKRNKHRNLWRFGLLLAVLFVGTGIYYYKNPYAFQTAKQQELFRPEVDDSRSVEQVQADFASFTQKIFESEVTSDSLTFHYTLADPEKAGIECGEPSLGSYSLSDFRDDLLVSENWLASLRSYPYDKLSEEQQLIYDILSVILETNLESTQFLEYSECLSPVSGIQAQLPILLAEYEFYKPEDVETYIQILQLIPEYFSQIIAFQEKKSQDGLFMSDSTADAVISQCQEFVADPEECYLIHIFAGKLKDVPDMSEQEKADYKKQNKTAVTKAVIPAYRQLIDCLTQLKGTGNNRGGLCKLDQGREYYEYLMKSKTGSARGMKEVNRMLDTTLRREQKTISRVMKESPDAYYDAEKPEYPGEDPLEMLEDLQKQIAADFTTLPDGIHCKMKYVDESLEDSCSPAFYLTSPIDRYQENVIYLNQSEEYDLSQAFTTVAHESYPGHLYQNAYFQSTEPSPVRSIVNVGGYIEGWGTYAELYSYDLAGLKPDTAKLLKANTLATLCLYAKADIEVNYFGWNLKKLADYLDAFGFSASQSQIIYDTVIADPVSYMQYTLGYLEIVHLKEKAQKKLGNRFSVKEFHDFLLGIGPAPFLVIEDRMQGWIKDSMKRGSSQ